MRKLLQVIALEVFIRCDCIGVECDFPGDDDENVVGRSVLKDGDDCVGSVNEMSLELLVHRRRAVAK
jgi:hypothetical protein